MLDMFEFHQGFDIRCIPLLDPLSTLLPLGMFLLSACGAHHLCLFLMISLAATSSCFPQRASRIVVLLPLQNLQLFAKYTMIKSEACSVKNSVISSISPITVVSLPTIVTAPAFLCLYTLMTLTMA